ncbi:MAG: biotin/lipoyl-containing protein, partial [Paracoccaceae bacterium]
MPIEILMPALSPTMEEGTLAKWLVKEGDTVASGDLLAEIETDKATMEFEAVDEGIIGKLLVAEGTENVAVNSAIAVLLEDGEAASEVAAAPSASASPAPAPESAISNPATLASSPASAPRTAPEKAAESARVFATPLARKLAAQN